MSDDFLAAAMAADDDLGEVTSIIFDEKLKEGVEEVDDKERLRVGPECRTRGIVLETGEWEGNFGPMRTFAVKDADRKRTLRIFASSTILAKDMASVEAGDFVSVTYHGKRKSKSGDVEYASFTVHHRPAPRAVSDATVAESVVKSVADEDDDFDPESF